MRRFPLKYSKYEIGMIAAIMLVLLRLSIGWHFLYEGVWKIKHADEFSAEPFLTSAKGPAAPLFHAMVYDIDGRRRLQIEKDPQGNDKITARVHLDAWRGQLDAAIRKYKLDEKQKTEAEALYARYEKSVEDYLDENFEDIAAYFNSLDRFEGSAAAGSDGTAFQKKRTWYEQQKLRSEVRVWLDELDGLGDDYRMALWDLLADDQKDKGSIPVGWTRSDLMDFAVTYGLTAIGVCLMLGLCTRLACLGGGAFLIAVLLTQPHWPTIYPPAPAATGHALGVDRNFVEMIAMFMLATTAVGRWGGLDGYVYQWFGRPILKRLGLVAE